MDTRFPSLTDVTWVRQFVNEYAERHYTTVQYRVLDEAASIESDEVHDETPEYSKRWKDAIALRAYFRPDDQMFPLSLFGIEQLREMTLFTDVQSLINAGLATEDAVTREVTLLVGPGDRFTYSEDREYDVLLWKRGPAFANTDVPVVFWATAEKVRREATSYEGL